MTWVACGVVALCAGLPLARTTVRDKPLPIAVTVQPEKVLADGSETAVVSIATDAAHRPALSIVDNSRGALVESIEFASGEWRGQVRAGIVPGPIVLKIEARDHLPASAVITAELDSRDTLGDGTPDFLRLDDARDRRAFRRWFTYLAEAQFFQDASSRPTEINDCAALIRYAYREALRKHDSAWANSARLPLIPSLDSVEKYQYPFTPMGAALFRVSSGPFRSADLTNGAFLQFADAQTLWRFNTHFVSRDLERAQPGDLLFFRQESDHRTFHSMIYLGQSQLRPDGHRYVLYHTGPAGSDPGEMRRLTVEELMRFPQSEWRPIAANDAFLGVARWNILRPLGYSSEAAQ